MQAGAALTIAGAASLSGGSVAGGRGGPGNGGDGLGTGPGLFFQGAYALTIDATGTQTIADGISDQEGTTASPDGYGNYSIDSNQASGSVSLLVDGAGRVILAGSSSYTGGTTIKAGTLELAAAQAAGFAPITFAGIGLSLVVDSGASLILPGYPTAFDHSGGGYSPAPGGIAVGIGGSGDAVINSGVIGAGQEHQAYYPSFLVGGVGVALGAGETLTNTSTGLIQGGQGGGMAGGLYETGGHASNAGAIKGSDGSGNSGPKSPTGGGQGVFMSGGTLFNTGTIAGGAGGANLGQGLGVNLSGPALFTNSGIVQGGAGLVVDGPAGNVATAGASGAQIEGGATAVNLAGGSIIGGAGLGDPAYYLHGTAGTPANGPITEYGQGDAAVYLDGGTLDTAGVITGGSVAGAGPADAVYSVGNTDRVIARPGAVFNGAVVATGTADVLELGAPAAGGAAGVLSGVGSTVIGFASIAFDAGVSWTLGGSAAGLGAVHDITGFTARSGDIIDVTGVGLETSAALGAGNALSLSGGSATATIMLDPLASYAGDAFLLSTDGAGGTLVELACFAEGTRLRTPRGDVAVESLEVGEAVCVQTADGTADRAPVTWIGSRLVDVAAHPRPELAAPVRVARDAMAEGIPARDVRLSPDHALMIDGVLVPVRMLVNGATIATEKDVGRVRYYHVELDRHAVVLADGLPAESYLDTGNRTQFERSGPVVSLHAVFGADDAHATYAERGCARLATDVATVQPIWARLDERATALGRSAAIDATATSVAGAGLSLVVDGRTIRPVVRCGTRVVFALPRGVRSARLSCHAASPATAAAYLDDRRMLGASVERLVLSGEAGPVAIPLDHPGLAAGWHAIERAGGRAWRWTDGAATLDHPALSGASLLTIELSAPVASVGRRAA